jgi:transcription initiation factor IIF auxiliary subunit
MQVKSQLLTNGSMIPYKVFREGGREHYNVRIYISAPAEELNSIEMVEYMLHPSFHNPRRTSKDRENGFAIEIWTWGMFETTVTIHFRDGKTEDTSHYLKYSLPADDGSNYVRV